MKYNRDLKKSSQCVLLIALCFLIYPFVYAEDLSRKTVLITGGLTGTGKAIATAFLEDGWNVWCTSRTPDKYLTDPRIKVIKLDLSNTQSIKKALAIFKKNNERLDVLINNAGYGLLGPVENSDINQVRKQFETNVFGALQVIQATLPLLKPQSDPHIINISTAAAIRALPGLGIYSASKMALEGITEALAAELNQWNIRVSLVEIGAVKNDWIKNCVTAKKDMESDQYKNFTINFQKLGLEIAQNGQLPSEIGNLVLNIVKEKKPHFRYQTSLEALDVAREVYVDPSGDKVRNSMIKFCQQLGL